MNIYFCFKLRWGKKKSSGTAISDTDVELYFVFVEPMFKQSEIDQPSKFQPSQKIHQINGVPVDSKVNMNIR
jgi:hypothetical protein